MPDRLMRIVLLWFSLTTVIFWLVTIRGAFDGSSYQWGLFGWEVKALAVTTGFPSPARL